MALERKWEAVPPQLFTADGTQFGVVTVADTAGFKVKGFAQISANTLPTIQVQIQRVTSPTEMIVGPMNSQVRANNSVNLSAYTVALSSTILFPEQDKNKIKPDDIEQAVYESDPAVAIRNVMVDQYGNFIDSSIDANGKTRLAVDADVTVNTVQLFTKPYDAIQAAYPSSTQETYQTYVGGLSGTPVQLVTVNYTDSTKNFIQSVVRTG